jgi:hypothetical protein
MNYLRKLISYSSVVTTVLVSGCNTDNLKELNINPQAAPTIDLNFLLTSAQLGAASGASPVTGDNRYIDWRTNIGITSTTIQQLASDGGISNTGDKYLENVESYTAPWDFIYRNLNYLGEILRQTGPGGFAEGQNNNTKQAAIILKAFLFQRLTDYYGRIPYFEALQAPEGTFFPHYDKQKDIYLSLLNQLDSAATSFSTNEDPDFAAADLYYSGDVVKWKRWAYSLMLRLAMRLSKVDLDDANTWVAKAIAGGVFQKNDDNTIVPMAVGPSLWLDQNGISRAYLPGDGGEIANAFLSQKLVDFLKGANSTSTADDDPRLMIFSGGIYTWTSEDNYTPITTDPLKQKGMPNGKDINMLKIIENNPNLDPPTTYSRMNPNLLNRDEPYMLMNYGEVELLLAEAAERGIGGASDAKGHYEKGVRASMEMYTIYDPSFVVTPQQEDAYLAAHPYGVEKPALEMIGDQYWVNHFLNWWEAWSNWRRTGYPTLVPVNYPGNVTGGKIFQRLKYPNSEPAGNPNFDGASPNDYTTPVWWAGGPE